MQSAYDPEEFRKRAHAVVDLLADHLRDTGARKGPVLPMRPPEEELAAWANDFAGGADPTALLGEVVRRANHLQHPGFVGHQVSAPLPVTAISQMVGALLNNSMAVYEMGPVSTAMERVLLGWMGKRLGYDAQSDGLFTSGGSAGNLTALLAARQRMATRLGDDAFPGAVIACEEAHYSTERAVRVMGWGKGGLVKVAADPQFKMRAELLDEAIDVAERAGRKVVAVVASACSTSTGAFDPIERVADVCARRGVWMHVDGAHGASFALSPKYAHLLAGIARADSVVWDAHKMMLCPGLVTAVLFKDGKDAYGAFHSPDAAYLFDASAKLDAGKKTLECTKRMMSLEPYVALAVHGEAMVGAYLDRMVDLARAFAEKLSATPGFEVPVAPECNIVCFRYAEGDMDAVRRRLLSEGEFYLVRTMLRGKVYLRTTLINPRTTEDDLARLTRSVIDASRAT
jgi:L-2,4-diaminobutyrate decarboxylase